MLDATTAFGMVFAKFGVLITGFAGSVLSLFFLKDLTRPQAFAAVITGFLSSVFTTPFVVAYFNLPADVESRYGVAFLIGLLAMNLIPALKAAGERIFAPRGA